MHEYKQSNSNRNEFIIMHEGEKRKMTFYCQKNGMKVQKLHFHVCIIPTYT